MTSGILSKNEAGIAVETAAEIAPEIEEVCKEVSAWSIVLWVLIVTAFLAIALFVEPHQHNPALQICC